MSELAPVLYIPHGGGPMPLLDDPSHEDLITFLSTLPATLAKPEAIILVSGHWEESSPTITSCSAPSMLFDYYGFPAEAYEIDYPAPGSPDLAKKIQNLISGSQLNESRGYDHGAFVPLKLMYPQADIPCIQLSLIGGLNAARHIELGKCLSELRKDNIMIIGSGMSFHNMRALFTGRGQEMQTMKAASDVFNQWLIDTCTKTNLSPEEKAENLSSWAQAPNARFCHPREEHLLPLHVCFGAAFISNSTAEVIFNKELMGHKVLGLLWQ